ncbi:MAG: hypothetical protein U0744_05915 [Gemmataceae bacterium]
MTVDGKPAAGATIVFENAAAGIATTASIEGGAFEVKTIEGPGLPVGSYKVAVRPGGIMKPGEEVPLATQKGPAAASGPPIPEKYRTVATSGLAADVKPGTNASFQFDLK